MACKHVLASSSFPALLRAVLRECLIVDITSDDVILRCSFHSRNTVAVGGVNRAYFGIAFNNI